MCRHGLLSLCLLALLSGLHSNRRPGVLSDLAENLVYYRGDTHYWVMTPKLKSLVATGEICSVPRTISFVQLTGTPLTHPIAAVSAVL